MSHLVLLTIECSGFQPRVGLHVGLPKGTLQRPDMTVDRPPADARSAAELAPLIQRIYQRAGIASESTSAIAVTYGPGSFTSLRIGVTTAKMLAYCWKIPAIGINTLDLALAASWRTSSPSSAQQCWTAAINAYRKQVYAKQIRWSEHWDGQWPDAQAVRQRLQHFSQQFDQSFDVASTFDCPSPVEGDDARFQLNESQIRRQEFQIPQQIWQVEQATDAFSKDDWMATLARMQRVVVLENILAEGLPKDSRKKVHFPDAEDQDLAFAQLAWWSLLSLDDQQVHPFRLQPIYYRPSAAEEALEQSRSSES